MTWGELRQKIEDAGVTDEMQIFYIDVATESVDNVDVCLPQAENITRKLKKIGLIVDDN